MDRPDVFGPKSLVLYAVVAGLTWGAAQGALFYQALDHPYRLPGAPERIAIGKGAGAEQIGRHLAERGLVRSPWHFLGAAWLEDSLTRLQAGEYPASAALTPRQWVLTLRDGCRLQYRLTFPEGWTIDRMASQLEEAGLVPATAFLEAASNPALLQSKGIAAPSAEGYLFPETYLFEKPLSATGALEVFLREFVRQTGSLDPMGHEQVVLASIIEKEARRPEDMKKVAAVFHNRLKQGLPLESDATVHFALVRAGRPTEPLDTQFDSPYNTYVVSGLPPGAICNPGRAALEAAVHPATGEWLFFLSDSEGAVHFSRTHQEHVRLKRKLRLAQPLPNHRQAIPSGATDSAGASQPPKG